MEPVTFPMGPVATPSERNRLQRRRLPDIRPFLRDLRRHVGTTTLTAVLLEEDPIDISLLRDSATMPCVSNRIRRISSRPALTVSRSTRRATSPQRHHNFFSLTRRHQDKKKQLRQITLHSGSWNAALDMDWLRTAELEYPEEELEIRPPRSGAGAG